MGEGEEGEGEEGAGEGREGTGREGGKGRTDGKGAEEEED